MRWLYSLCWYLALPVIGAWLLSLMVRDPLWRRGLRERLGLPARRSRRGIWLHAASVGEVQAAAPLVQALRVQFPDLPLTLSTFTPSGREHAERSVPDDVRCVLLPFDFPGAARRFIGRLRPRLAIVVETELWPNLFAACARRQVPMLMVSARITEHTTARYRRWPRLVAATLAIPEVITTQTDGDAERLLALGADPTRVTVGGNIKFDFQLPDGLLERSRALRAELAGERPVWIAASTHGGEEEVVLDAHRRVREQVPEALLVLAPRHPGRADAIAGTVARLGFTLVRRSAATSRPAADVFLLDSLGELALFYGVADVAFVGGTLVPVGGHNLLEPAAFGVPVLCGPHVQNIEAMHSLLAGAAAVDNVTDGGTLARAVTALLTDPAERRRRGQAAREVLERNRGALARVMHLVDGVLS